MIFDKESKSGFFVAGGGGGGLVLKQKQFVGLEGMGDEEGVSS